MGQYSKGRIKIFRNSLVLENEPDYDRASGYGCDNDFFCQFSDGKNHNYHDLREECANMQRVVELWNCAADHELTNAKAVQAMALREMVMEFVLQYRYHPDKVDLEYWADRFVEHFKALPSED